MLVMSFSLGRATISKKSGHVLEVRVSVRDLQSLGSRVASLRSRDIRATAWRSRRLRSSRIFSLISSGKDCKLAFGGIVFIFCGKYFIEHQSNMHPDKLSFTELKPLNIYMYIYLKGNFTTWTNLNPLPEPANSIPQIQLMADGFIEQRNQRRMGMRKHE